MGPDLHYISQPVLRDEISWPASAADRPVHVVRDANGRLKAFDLVDGPRGSKAANVVRIDEP